MHIIDFLTLSLKLSFSPACTLIVNPSSCFAYFTISSIAGCKSEISFISSPIKSLPTTYGLLATAFNTFILSFKYVLLVFWSFIIVNGILLIPTKNLIFTPVSFSITGNISCTSSSNFIAGSPVLAKSVSAISTYFIPCFWYSLAIHNSLSCLNVLFLYGLFALLSSIIFNNIVLISFSGIFDILFSSNFIFSSDSVPFANTYL